MKAGDGPPLAVSASLQSLPVSIADQWSFQWADRASPEPLAQVSGRLRWGTFDLAFWADGLAGIDGRLAAPSLASLPPHLQQVVVSHFVQECLQGVAVGPLANLSPISVRWHENPVSLEGEFDFSLRRSGARGTTHGRLAALDAVGRTRMLNALVSAHWPVPGAFAHVEGCLEVGSLRLSLDEVASLEIGDLVWIDDAGLSPLGMRVRFQPDDGSAGCMAWVKRSTMKRDTELMDHSNDHQAADESFLRVRSLRKQTIARAWLQGSLLAQQLPSAVLVATWSACRGERSLCNGRLVLAGRRIGLRVTQLQRHATHDVEDGLNAGRRPSVADSRVGPDRDCALPGDHADVVREAGGGVQPRAQCAGPAASAARNGD